MTTPEDTGNVIYVGDFAIERKSRWVAGRGECQHQQMVMEERGDVVRCRDCKTQVSAFWALTTVLEALTRARRHLKSETERFNEERKKGVVLLAARAVEKAWRSKGMVPTCPHCSRGILAQDGLGAAQINKEFEIKRRRDEGPKRGVWFPKDDTTK